jgi:hypothetical protein
MAADKARIEDALEARRLAYEYLQQEHEGELLAASEVPELRLIIKADNMGALASAVEVRVFDLHSLSYISHATTGC